MGILDRIQDANDIKKLSLDELYELASEIREFLINNVSKTGGHLASNLGVVELTLALHKVFDTEKDRLVFDVGHQCYVHKMLTGRKGGFADLRKFGGMSGFLRPSESVHDACVSGHASNSVSVALGMARARTLQGENYSVISVIGDGALTGGLAYEGLCDAGHSKEPLIVILNDNEMSITKNVGAITEYLSRLRLKPSYLRFRDRYRRFMKKTRVGVAIDNIIHRIKDVIKNLCIPSLMFEDMGFTYLGPADGHDIKYMTYLLELARDLARPVVIHLTTVKGKGYPYAEERPWDFHGVSKFDIETGDSLSDKKAQSFSSAFGEEMCKLAEENTSVCAITAAMTSGVGLSAFAKQFPERFFDVAIAEGHAVAMAAGLAAQGMTPVFAVYSTFLQRAYDMLIHDVAISNQHIVLAVDRAGLVGEDGETHHGVFDVAYLSDVPNMTILAPSSLGELRAMLRYAVEAKEGAYAVRYPRGSEGRYNENSFGRGEGSVCLKEGKDITVVTYGNMLSNVLGAAETAEKNGISCEIIKLNLINPLNCDNIFKSVEKTGKVLVVEDVIRSGSVFEKLSAKLSAKGVSCKAYELNIGSGFVQNGELSKLYELLGLDSCGIYKKIAEACKL